MLMFNEPLNEFFTYENSFSGIRPYEPYGGRCFGINYFDKDMGGILGTHRGPFVHMGSQNAPFGPNFYFSNF